MWKKKGYTTRTRIHNHAAEEYTPVKTQACAGLSSRYELNARVRTSAKMHGDVTVSIFIFLGGSTNAHLFMWHAHTHTHHAFFFLVKDSRTHPNTHTRKKEKRKKE